MPLQEGVTCGVRSRRPIAPTRAALASSGVVWDNPIHGKGDSTRLRFLPVQFADRFGTLKGADVEHDDRIRITKLRELIRDVPDFPKPGVVFWDITPLLANPAGLSLAVEYLTQPFRHQRVDLVAGAESRGFIFGTAVARNLSAGFIPIRKPGRLPADTHSEPYALEYGKDAVEIHKDAMQPGDHVLMVDDLLATGGTMAACCQLVRSLGGKIVGIAVLIELAYLNGRSQLRDYPVHSILTYDSEAPLRGA